MQIYIKTSTGLERHLTFTREHEAQTAQTLLDSLIELGGQGDEAMDTGQVE